MLYSCTYVATGGVNGLTIIRSTKPEAPLVAGSQLNRPTAGSTEALLNYRMRSNSKFGIYTILRYTDRTRLSHHDPNDNIIHYC